MLFSLGIEKADKFKPTTSRPPALHLRFYSSVSVWRGTEGGGVDAHRKRHLNQDYLTPGNKREGAYGCCLDLIASQNTSEIAKFRIQLRITERWGLPWATPPPPTESTQHHHLYLAQSTTNITINPGHGGPMEDSVGKPVLRCGIAASKLVDLLYF